MIRILSLVVCCIVPAFAQAASVSFSFSGTVDQVLSTPPAPFAAIQVGDPFHVNYTLEVNTPDHDDLDNFGTFSGAVESYEVTIDGISATTLLGGVNTANASALAPEDTYAAIGLFEDFSTTLSFKDATGAAIGPQDDLSTIDLAGFRDRTFLLLNGVFPSITGTLSVPEPEAITMVLVGLISLLLRRPRKRS